jgi:hypothetical protein
MGAFFKVILLRAAPKDTYFKGTGSRDLGFAQDRIHMNMYIVQYMHMYIFKEQLHEIYFKYFSKIF